MVLAAKAQNFEKVLRKPGEKKDLKSMTLDGVSI